MPSRKRQSAPTQPAGRREAGERAVHHEPRGATVGALSVCPVLEATTVARNMRNTLAAPPGRQVSPRLIVGGGGGCRSAQHVRWVPTIHFGNAVSGGSQARLTTTEAAVVVEVGKPTLAHRLRPAGLDALVQKAQYPTSVARPPPPRQDRDAICRSLGTEPHHALQRRAWDILGGAPGGGSAGAKPRRAPSARRGRPLQPATPGPRPPRPSIWAENHLREGTRTAGGCPRGAPPAAGLRQGNLCRGVTRLGLTTQPCRLGIGDGTRRGCASSATRGSNCSRRGRCGVKRGRRRRRRSPPAVQVADAPGGARDGIGGKGVRHAQPQ